MLKERVWTALLMLVVFGGLVFFAPRQLWFAAVAILMAWTSAEWAGLAQFSQRSKAVFVLVMPVLLAVLWIGMTRYWGQWVFTGVILASMLFWLALVPMWLFNGWRLSHRGFLAVCGALALLPAGLGFLVVRPSVAEAGLLIGLLAVVWIADSAAYFSGRAWGRHKLAPSISPGKTREGALGAWLAVCVYLVVVVYVWSPMGLVAGRVSWWQLALISLVLTYQSIMGDLFESWLKRCAGVKDSGASLPGHGGILDRVDAILPVLPLQIVLLGYVLR